jgi:hypothetical protein
MSGSHRGTTGNSREVPPPETWTGADITGALAMPHANDHDRIPQAIDTVANDIATTSKWHDELTIGRPRRWMATLGHLLKGLRRGKQQVENMDGEFLTVRFDEFAEPQ